MGYGDWASTQELSLVCRYFVQGGCSDTISSFVAPPDDPAQKHPGFLIGLTVALFFLLLLPLFFFLRHLKAKSSTSLRWRGKPGQTPQVIQIKEGKQGGTLLGAGRGLTEPKGRRHGLVCWLELQSPQLSEPRLSPVRSEDRAGTSTTASVKT